MIYIKGQNYPELMLRTSKKITDIFPIALILSLVIMFAGDILGDLIIKIPAWQKFALLLTGDAGSAEFLGMYFSCIGVWIITLLFIIIPKKNRPIVKSLGHNRNGNNLKGFLTGLLLGFGTNGICILFAAITGKIKLYFYGFDPLILFAFLVAVMIQSGSEEIIDRLYLYQKLRRRYTHPAVAIIGNSLVFMALHIPNPGFNVFSGIEIFVSALIMSMMVYYYDSMWAAIAFHTAWNFTQNILFGLPNSGIVSSYALFKLDAASAQGGFFYDPAFGVEGCAGSCLILVIVCSFMFLKNRGKAERTDLWQKVNPMSRDS